MILMQILLLLIFVCNIKYSYASCSRKYDGSLCVNVVLNSDNRNFRIENYHSYSGEDKITFINSTITILHNDIFSNYEKTTRLFINSSNVQTIMYKAFHNLYYLNELYLQNNDITKLYSGTFNDLNQLRTLNLSNNYISSLEQNVFRDLENLNYLDISYNNLSSVNKDLFLTTRNLTDLLLNNNNIKEIQEDLLYDLNALEFLDLSHNNIYFIYSAMFKKKDRLKYLKLNDNHITSLSKESLHNIFASVHVLDLSNNNMISQEFIVPFNKFTYLDLNDKYLEVLLLNNMNITIIDEDLFENLFELKILHLQKNHITKIPIGTFRDLHQLEELNLNYNNITHIDAEVFSALENLHKLNLAFNKIQHLDISVLYPLINLKEIHLNDNLLSFLDIQTIFDHMHRKIDKSIITIYLQNNFWQCDWLRNAFALLQKNNFNVIKGNSFKGSNVKGIACMKTKNDILIFTTTTMKSVLPTTMKTTTTKIYIATSKKIEKLNDFNYPVTTTSSVDEREFQFYKSYDKIELLLKSTTNMQGLLIFIIILLFVIPTLYVLYTKVFSKYKRTLETNNENMSESCNLQILNSNE